jgi:hypothetical protein
VTARDVDKTGEHTVLKLYEETAFKPGLDACISYQLSYRRVRVVHLSVRFPHLQLYTVCVQHPPFVCLLHERQGASACSVTRRGGTRTRATQPCLRTIASHGTWMLAWLLHTGHAENMRGTPKTYPVPIVGAPYFPAALPVVRPSSKSTQEPPEDISSTSSSISSGCAPQQAWTEERTSVRGN